MLLVAAAWGAMACSESRSQAMGRKLFEGQLPLVARLAGDDMLLPPEASRCANCHLLAAAGGPADASGTATFGPPLTAVGLAQPQRRRGGPRSRYSVETFCTVLRSGVDPAHILVERAMPRYQIDNEGCQALWRHLTGLR